MFTGGPGARPQERASRFVLRTENIHVANKGVQKHRLFAQRLFLSISSSTVVETGLKDLAGAVLWLAPLCPLLHHTMYAGSITSSGSLGSCAEKYVTNTHCHEQCWRATFMGILYPIKYSPSKVLAASETVLAFGWAKTCSARGFPHSSSSTVPG